MNTKIILILLTVLLFGCNELRERNDQQSASAIALSVDTIVGSTDVLEESGGSYYVNKALQYYVIIGKDTSDFSCVISESKKDGRLSINLNRSHAEPTVSYRKRMEDMRIILPAVSKDFNLDSLSGLFMGRLILNGDLAIAVTKEYQTQFATTDGGLSNLAVGQFLKESTLGTDLNDLLKDYSLAVDKVMVEKAFFTRANEIYAANKLETDSTNVPDKILDCLTWVTFKKSQ